MDYEIAIILVFNRTPIEVDNQLKKIGSLVSQFSPILFILVNSTAHFILNSKSSDHIRIRKAGLPCCYFVLWFNQ